MLPDRTGLPRPAQINFFPIQNSNSQLPRKTLQLLSYFVKNSEPYNPRSTIETSASPVPFGGRDEWHRMGWSLPPSHLRKRKLFGLRSKQHSKLVPPAPSSYFSFLIFLREFFCYPTMLLESGQRLGLRACASEQTTPFRKIGIFIAEKRQFAHRMWRV